MQQINEWKAMVSESLSNMVNEIGQVVPSLLAAIVILIVGFLVTKLVVGIIKKGLKLIKADKLDDKLNEIDFFGGKTLNFNIVTIVSQFVKWVLYIVILIIVSDVLNLKIISAEISNLLRYLPSLFTALVIFVVGLLLANAIKKVIRSFFESMELSGSKFISSLVFGILLIFVSITALNQAGIDTTIITSNLIMVLGGLLLAFSVAFGLGARNVVESLLKAFYARKIYEIGQVVKFNNIEGEIEAINNISVTIKTTSGKKLIVPISEISDNQVEIHE